MNPSVIARLVRKARDLTFADPESPFFIAREDHALMWNAHRRAP
jgi:hypothetical protein